MTKPIRYRTAHRGHLEVHQTVHWEVRDRVQRRTRWQLHASVELLCDTVQRALDE